MISHIISERSKLVQKEYKSRHDWEGKVIHCELCKKFKFDQRNKWYVHNPESARENEMHKVLRDFAIQTDDLTSDRRPDLMIVKRKKTLLNSGIYRLGKPQSKIKRKIREISALALLEN